MHDDLRQQLQQDLRRILLGAIAAVTLLALAPHASASEPAPTAWDIAIQVAIEVAQTELEAGVLEARERSAEERNPHFAALVEGTFIRRVTLKCVVPHADGMRLSDCSDH